MTISTPMRPPLRRLRLPVRALRRDERHIWEDPLPFDPYPDDHLEGPKRWYTTLHVAGAGRTQR